MSCNLIDPEGVKLEQAQISVKIGMSRRIDRPFAKMVVDCVGNIEKGDICFLTRWDLRGGAEGRVGLVFYYLADLFGNVPLFQKHSPQLAWVQHLDKE